MRSILRCTAAVLATLLATPTVARPAATPLTLERVVMLMRHGVRPPTKAPPMPAGIATEAWPEWPVKPGYLTPHGAQAVAKIGAADRAAWIAAGLLPKTGCGSIAILADSDERTISTARAYAGAIAPGCDVSMTHKPQDVADALFSPLDEGTVTIDPAAARAGVLKDLGAGGIAAAEAGQRPILRRLDAILCGAARTSCGIGATPTDLAAPVPGKRPKLTGALDRASTVAQILLLEYAEGKPMRDVGWGRATAADIEHASALHALEFAILARPHYVAARNVALIGAAMRDAVTKADAPTVTMLSGHDTNVASLGGLLDLHWKVPGLAADDPSPGGALLFERLVDGAGQHYVRAVYRSQTLDQIRAIGSRVPYRAVMPLPGCSARGTRGLCTLAQFDALMRSRLTRS